MKAIEVRTPAFADVPGARLAWTSFGREDAAPLLLVRGLGTQMIEWPQAFVDAFVQRGFRVIVFDNRDVGLSSDHADAPYVLADMARDCVGLLDALGIDRARVLGISMGGMIVQRLAIEHAARFTHFVSVMSSTGNPALPRPAPEVMEALLAPAPAEREAAIEQNAAHRALFGSPGYPLAAPERRKLARRALERAWRPDGVARQMAAVLADGARHEALARVDAPVLVVHGEADPLVPITGGEDTARSVPGAEFERVPGMGHDLPEALAEVLAERVVRFFEAPR